MSSNPYRLSHPEYREKERELDRQRKKEKYANDEEYRQKMKKKALDIYNKKKPETRCCKSCENQIEYKPRIVYCIDCYKKKTNWNNKKVEFLED